MFIDATSGYLRADNIYRDRKGQGMANLKGVSLIGRGIWGIQQPGKKVFQGEKLEKPFEAALSTARKSNKDNYSDTDPQIESYRRLTKLVS